MSSLTTPTGLRVKIRPLVLGGHQEKDLRAGTENVAGIVGFVLLVATIIVCALLGIVFFLAIVVLERLVLKRAPENFA